MVGFFFRLVRPLEVYERQSPGDSSELPGYLDTSLPTENTIKDSATIYAPLAALGRFSFRPPSTSRFHS